MVRLRVERAVNLRIVTNPATAQSGAREVSLANVTVTLSRDASLQASRFACGTEVPLS